MGPGNISPWASAIRSIGHQQPPIRVGALKGKARSCFQTHPRLAEQTSRLEIQNVYYIYRDKEQVFYGWKDSQFRPPTAAYPRLAIGGTGPFLLPQPPVLGGIDRPTRTSKHLPHRKGWSRHLFKNVTNSKFRTPTVAYPRWYVGEDGPFFFTNPPILGGGDRSFRNSKHLLPIQWVDKTSIHGRKRIAVYAANGSLYALVLWGGGPPVLASKPIRSQRKRPIA